MKRLTGLILAAVAAASAGAATLNTNREEVLAYFAENVYGVRPDLSQFEKKQAVVACTNDPIFRATRKTIALNVMTPWGERTFKAVAFVPHRTDGRKPPVYAYIAFRSLDQLLERPIGLKTPAHRWPVEQILARGAATVAFCYEDVFSDNKQETRPWATDPNRPANGWGALSTWALAASRVMDYLETDADVDASRVAVVGLSRLGKTALWAGATDPRFAYVVIDESGCLGARASRCNVRGETIDQITSRFPHWFAPNCWTKLAKKDAEVPIDQDSLVAACAPRLLAISSAEDDEWSCPAGEHFSFETARAAWGDKKNRAHYFFRRGPHDLRHDDWADYLDFAATHGWQRLDGSWCSCGTSITWYDTHVATNRFEKGYQDVVRETLGFNSFTNVGLNGSCVAAIPQELPKCDWYTIEHGVNDWGHTTPIGTWADYVDPRDTRNFYADYRRFVNRIRAVNPNAKIILCTPRKSYGFGTYLPPTADGAKGGLRLFEYAQAVREIAYREGLGLADFYAEAGDDAELAALSIDLALHPNTRGYRLMAQVLEKAFLRENARAVHPIDAQLETAEWQGKIDAASAAGGGRVVVPAGRHVTGGLVLKDNVELHLEEGAILEGSPRTNDYPVVKLPYSEGDWMAVVMAVGAKNVAITGKGMVLGNGTAFILPPNYGNLQEGWRPRGLFFGNCTGVRLADFTLRDAGCWGCVVQCCRTVDIRRLTIDTHANANNDGIDLEASDVVIADCDIDAGDDAVCLKSNNPDFAVERVLVTNVTARSHCVPFKLGTASHGIMRDILFVDCRAEAPRRDSFDYRPGRNKLYFDRHGWFSNIFPGLDPTEACGISSTAVECCDGGLVENVVFRNCTLGGAVVPVFVRASERKKRSTGAPRGRHNVMRHIVYENVTGTAMSGVANSVTGIPGFRIEDVTFRNVRFTSRPVALKEADYTRPVPESENLTPGAYIFEHPLPAYGLYARHVDGLTLENAIFEVAGGATDPRPAVVRDDVK